MTYTRTYTREELALKRIVSQETVGINGRKVVLEAIIRVNGSFFVRWADPEMDSEREAGTVPIEAVKF